jgi:hypothetical protein
MKDLWNPGTVHLHVIPKPGERGFVDEHRCWNKDLFIESRREAYAKEGGAVAVITQNDFNELKERK